jgi:hypothetical protein
MKRLFMAGIAAAAMIAGTSAMAQDEAPPGPPPGTMEKTTTTTTTWTVQPEERTVIHDYIGRARVRPEAVNEEITVGAPIPQDVELQPVPEEIYTKVPEAQRYEYFDWDGRMVFVDPDSRRVVQIVD